MSAQFIDPAETAALVAELQAREDRTRAFREGRAHRSALSDVERLRGLLPDDDPLLASPPPPIEIARTDGAGFLANLAGIADGKAVAR